MRATVRMLATALLSLGLGLASSSVDARISSSPSANVSYARGYQPMLSTYAADDRPPNCPPCPDCFNCQLPAFNCAQFGECSEYDGICTCPSGFGGPDCLSPLCGSPADGAKRFPREDGKDCDCSAGWDGLNCNVCQNDQACSDFLLGGDRLGGNGTCYKGGQTLRKSFQECDVTNQKILDLLPGRLPQVTFSCDKSDASCNFQFWIGHQESFYCGLKDCKESTTSTTTANTTRYECEKVQCSCIPGRMLCGEDGSVDISEFLADDIKGPGQLICKSSDGGKKGRSDDDQEDGLWATSTSGNANERDCRFEEKSMNQLISDIFGDPAIFLSCTSGECVHYSEVPGYEAPKPPPVSFFWVAFSAAGAVVFVALVSVSLYLLGRHDRYDRNDGAVRLPEEENARLVSDHVPASLQFEGISYRLGEKKILQNVRGSVNPGEIMAVMGASGAGKSTFLDLLARRNKRGYVSGTTLVNGKTVTDSEFKRMVGYVDQTETLMSTLTVYETVLYSALLRLPRDMSLDAKKLRTLETLEELGILGIKDHRIGGGDHRGISGGEARRTSIACELVTSPSILMLDEPTSGLDAYNAYNVVESLVSLARNYRRTVIFTIHQPRSNIVALFDRLLLLAAGRIAYSGPFDQCVRYFDDIGQPCPPGFNLADYLIDLTASTMTEKGSDDSGTPVAADGADTERHVEEGLLSAGSAPADEGERTELRTRHNSMLGAVTDGSPMNSMRSRRDRIAEGLRNAFNTKGNGPQQVSERLQLLFDNFDRSAIAADLQAEIDASTAQAEQRHQDGEQARNGDSTGAGTTTIFEGGDAPFKPWKKAGLWTQFTILSGRAFKNLYRNPLLMLAHYVMAAVLALFCGLLYHNLTTDISGFQNRLGLFFFILSLFGFSCLTSLGVFANERALFVKERANGYYSPVTYFVSKLLFDILPLRVIPPFILGAIVYFVVGLVPEVTAFWKFVLVLVLFSLAASSAVFFISIAIKDTGVANLVGSLTMLFSLLFAGLLINRDRIPVGLRWLQHLSFFHAAYEALIVNELRKLTLKEHKYGVDIDVPAASIISSFGFDSQAFWWPDIATLGIQFAAFTLLSLVWLVLFVRERK